MISRVPQPKQETRETQATSASVEALRDSLRAVPILDGRLFESVQIVAGTDKIVTHGLGRVPQGYIVTRQRGAAAFDVYAVHMTSTVVALRAANTITLDLWIF